MISDDLHALGFDFPTWEDMMVASLEANDLGIPDIGGYEYVSPYTDPSGARLQRYYRDGEWRTATSFAAERSRWRARVGMVNDDVALVDLLDDAGEIHNRLTVSVDDPFSYPRLAGPGQADADEPRLVDPSDLNPANPADPSAPTGMLYVNGLRLTALASDVVVHADETAWRENRRTRPVVADTPAGRVRGFDDPGFILAPWTFEYFSGGDPEEVLAYVTLALRLDDVETRVNQLSGVAFHVASGKLGENLPPLELCLPADTEPAPRPGAVVEGTVFLVGTSGVWDG